jgi:YegS/Rv2252/BmrU family lipid kinase
MQTPHLLINPHAGGGRARTLIPALQAWGAAQATPATVKVADTVPQALDWLRALPRGATVALVGGDGTINQLLPAFLSNDLTLGLVPRGSGNDVARALGVAGLSWQAALQLIESTPPRAMDVGWMRTPTEERPFLSSLTVGFDSAVGFKALHGPRWLRGLPRYLLATLRELSALQTWDMRVTLDGEDLHSGTTLFASTLNTPSYGSGMPAVPHAQIDDGMLDVLVAGRFNVAQTLVMLPRLLLGRHLNHPRVRNRSFRTMSIASAQPLPLATDGEYVGESPTLTVQVAPAALRVVRR